MRYPILMKNLTGDVVLFIKDRTGVVVSPGPYCGVFSESWDMRYFGSFEGEIVLTNKEQTINA